MCITFLEHILLLSVTFLYELIYAFSDFKAFPLVHFILLFLPYFFVCLLYFL
jgi:hypothetical protein